MNRADLHRLILAIKDVSSRIGRVRDAVAATGQATVDAIAENTKAAEASQEPKLVSAEVHLPSAEVQRYYSEQDKTYRLQRRIFWATVGTLLAVAGYAVITYLQWCQMKRATNLSEKANRDAWTLANRANRTALNSERPWVGMAINISDWTVSHSPVATILYINSGRRPAKVLLARFDSRDFDVFPTDPPYQQHRTDVHGTGLILPNGSMSNTQMFTRLTQDRLNELGLRTHAFFIYASVDYEDPLTHAEHWTHGCWQYLPGFNNQSSGFVNCAVYNDVDEEKQEQP